mmetsp:Transcript_52045/g.149249  ORF Transcript_52045/g.149249 Transcript_52045/m.149249 type:complete len:214 (+) Transcript_52045:162-803(+)
MHLGEDVHAHNLLGRPRGARRETQCSRHRVDLCQGHGLSRLAWTESNCDEVATLCGRELGHGHMASGFRLAETRDRLPGVLANPLRRDLDGIQEQRCQDLVPRHHTDFRSHEVLVIVEVVIVEVKQTRWLLEVAQANGLQHLRQSVEHLVEEHRVRSSQIEGNHHSTNATREDFDLDVQSDEVLEGHGREAEHVVIDGEDLCRSLLLEAVAER